ncbi:conjugal transfer protein TraD [Rhodococcus erythropolis]|nr:conjugal transfer protein TraD [Rhodococcus erythropolis]
MLILKAIAVAIPASFLPVIAYHLGGGENGSWNPLGLILSVATGKRSWPWAATGILVAMILVLAALVIGVMVALKNGGSQKKDKEDPVEQRLDKFAESMTDPRTIKETNPVALAKTTARIAPAISKSHPGYGGIVMGRSVKRNLEVRMPWEWVAIAIAGSRMGKSAALAIPAMCYAPGAAIGTSNKKDIYTHTLYLRKQMGRVWLFDLQGVTSGNPRERATFWFNPLRPVHDLPTARVVCDYFISAATDEGAKVDAYFDGAARDLFGSYVLAAALAGGDMRHVSDWLRATQSQIPVVILASRGYPDLANAMRSKQNVNAKQRDGFYDMARRFLAPLDEPRYEQAILPNARLRIGIAENGEISTGPGQKVHTLPEFVAEDFVRSTDTVYAMSMEGPGSASALTTALIGAVGDAAQMYGASQASGRMPIPLVAVLDEAANICKLQQLPNWYSHFGSRGIILITILQSPSQAKGVWGETKFDAMKDACNMIWYGGNVDDDNYINSLSNAIGDHHVSTESRNKSAGFFASGQSSVTQSWQKEKILEPDNLKALPGTRAIITLAGSKPILVRKNFWSSTPFAADINRSIAECDAGTERVEQKALPVGFSDQPNRESTLDQLISDDDYAPNPYAAEPEATEASVVVEVPIRRIERPTADLIDSIFESEFFSEGTN